MRRILALSAVLSVSLFGAITNVTNTTQTTTQVVNTATNVVSSSTTPTEPLTASSDAVAFANQYNLRLNNGYVSGTIPWGNVFNKGPFNAFDFSLGGVINKDIRTKIVNDRFYLILAKNPGVVTTTDSNGFDVNVSVYDMNNNEKISNTLYFSPTQPINNTTNLLKGFTATKASKDARIGFKLCAIHYPNGSYKLYKFDKCSDTTIHECDYSANDGNPHLRLCYSDDNFAVRPYSFELFGQNIYKKAGEDFNLIIKAVDENNFNKDSGTVNDVSGVEGYNENLGDLNFTSNFYDPSDTEVKQMNDDVYPDEPNDLNKTRVAYCPSTGEFTINNSSDDFNNGEVQANLNYSESGILTLIVSEKEGSEFAKVDEKDTPDNDRFIKPATFIVNQNDLSQRDLVLAFIPYKFVVDGNYTSSSNSNFIYMSNEPNMAAVLNYNIVAENKNGDKLKNFTKHCFPDYTANAPVKNGLKLNTTFDLYLDMNLNSSDKATINIFGKEYNLTEGDNTLNKVAWISSTSFDNAEGNTSVYFNMKKDYSQPKNVTIIKILDINSSIDWGWDPGITFIPKTIDKSMEFRYGRIDINNIAGYGNELNTTYKYEYWTDDKGWVVNKDHNSWKDGDINIANAYYDKDNITINVPNGIQNGEEKVEFRTTHALPYSTKIHWAISSWLWYNPLAKEYKNPSSTNLDCLTHPCETLTFDKSQTGWGGIGKENVKSSETNRTANIDAASKEIKGNKEEVRKLNW